MITSSNLDGNTQHFESIAKKAIDRLRDRAAIDASTLLDYGGKKFENVVMTELVDVSVGTSFENTFELVSGQKFPDIIAKKYFGIEVKTTTQNHWKSTGSSILESTRVDGIERIYMLFGKLHTPIDFKFRKYQECLPEVVVTHSPRYLIDMDTGVGETIFDKIGLEYDVLRKKENPIKEIVSYYKSKLKKGQELWWISDNEREIERSTSISLKVWNTLSGEERKNIIIDAVVRFPEILGSEKNKYERVALWMVRELGVVCPNVRDSFSAGGQSVVKIENYEFKNVPRILKNVVDWFPQIIDSINKMSDEEAQYYFGVSRERRVEHIRDSVNAANVVGDVNRFGDYSAGDTVDIWKRKVLESIKKSSDVSEQLKKEMMHKLFYRK